MGRLFGTDGVRGVFGVEMTGELAYKLGLAAGTFYGSDSRILIGRDVRRGGEILLSAVVAGLLEAGVKPYIAGYTPIPALQYAIKELEYDGGVMITASHNPPEYNGIKLLGPEGVELSRRDEKEVEEVFFEEKYSKYKPVYTLEKVEREDRVLEVYVRGVLKVVDVDEIKKKNFKVLVDPANSVSTLTSPLIAKMLGCKVYTLNGHLDPDFPGRHPEPTVETLIETSKVSKTLNVDFAIAHDGDGDRAIFIDEKGSVHWGDKSATLLIKHLVENRGLRGKVVTAVSSSIMVEEVLKPLGVEVVWTKVGSIDIAYKMRELKREVICGFEENGGFIYPPHQLVRDGGLTLALMLETIAYYGEPMSKLFDKLPRYYPIKVKIPISREEASKAVGAIIEAYRGFQMVTVDGVKVLLEDGWFLVRPSGTEPVLRIMVEGKSRERAEKILREVKKIVERVKS